MLAQFGYYDRVKSKRRNICLFCKREQNREHRRKYPDKKRLENAIYRANNPEKFRAYKIIERWVGSLIPKRNKCLFCHRPAIKHHWSYKPKDALSVYWVCWHHHSGVHLGRLSLAGIDPVDYLILSSKPVG